MRTRIIKLTGISFILLACSSGMQEKPFLKIVISENNRFLMTEAGDPFFWLGDTGWLLFTKLDRADAARYFDNRRSMGFNVIQAMVLHDVQSAVNIYGDSALINKKIDQPLVTAGNSPHDSAQYDYWDHMEYIIDLAKEKGLFLGLVPVWGSNVRSGSIGREQARIYSTWLAERFRDKPNIIWLNGGDVKGSDSTEIWKIIGKTIHQISKEHLMTFHPFGRTQSSNWFHDESWLDFNMFQSGHRRYDQDTTGLQYGEDNYRYVRIDYEKKPVKPTLDGEPSYEGIPQGLHDPSQPYWTDSDVRRYAYWSVFAGGCGFTYGHNAIMQFHREGDQNPAYGVRESWEVALDAPGASQMRYLKQLMLSRPYFDRIPAQEIIVGKPGIKHEFIAATKGNNYAFIYTYRGDTIQIELRKLHFHRVSAQWYNPRNGRFSDAGEYISNKIISFDPPGEKLPGNDWVLVLDSI